MAIRCTIIPPMETPAMCAFLTPAASSTAIPSLAMSFRLYLPVGREERPTSRLSKRMAR